MEHSGPLMWAWVRIPLLTDYFTGAEEEEDAMTQNTTVCITIYLLLPSLLSSKTDRPHAITYCAV